MKNRATTRHEVLRKRDGSFDREIVSWTDPEGKTHQFISLSQSLSAARAIWNSSMRKDICDCLDEEHCNYRFHLTDEGRAFILPERLKRLAAAIEAVNRCQPRAA